MNLVTVTFYKPVTRDLTRKLCFLKCVIPEFKSSVTLIQPPPHTDQPPPLGILLSYSYSEHNSVEGLNTLGHKIFISTLLAKYSPLEISAMVYISIYFV